MEKITFKDYYSGLSPVERNKLIATLMLRCCKSYQTIWRWINGKSNPGILEIKEIVRCTGIPAEELFPCIYTAVK